MSNKDFQAQGPDPKLFENWVCKNYGDNSRTKTITKEKYLRICALLRGEQRHSNAKFRFWVRSKGFRLLKHKRSTDEIFNDPNGDLYISLHAKEESTSMIEGSIENFLRINLPPISFFRKVAVVNEFYEIIKEAHIDDKEKHAGQKKTYRLVSDTYAFLPREVITFYLLNCDTCKPRIQKYGPIQAKIRQNIIDSRPSYIPSCCLSPKEKEQNALEHTKSSSKDTESSPTFFTTTQSPLKRNGNYSIQSKTEIQDTLEDEIIDPVGEFDDICSPSSAPYSVHQKTKGYDDSSFQHGYLWREHSKRFQLNCHHPYSYTPRNDQLDVGSSHRYPYPLFSSHPKQYDLYRRSLDTDFAERHGLVDLRRSLTNRQNDVIFEQRRYPSFTYNLNEFVGDELFP